MNDQPKARSEKRKRTVLVGVRLTPAEKHDIETIASLFGVSVGELVRARCCSIQPGTPGARSMVHEGKARMSDGKVALAEAIRKHKPTSKRINHTWRKGLLLNIPACKGCDWAVEDGDHDAHVAEVLAALPGVAVIQLPQPEDASGDVSDFCGGDVWCTPGSGRVRIYVQDSRFSAEEARSFAADVMAAAVLSEETTK